MSVELLFMPITTTTSELAGLVITEANETSVEMFVGVPVMNPI